LLNRALNVAKRVFWIAPARPSECMAQESQAIGIRCEPCRVEPRGIVMRIMQSTA
jgi:hypothetical protein